MKPITMSGLTFTWNRKCSCYQFSLPPRLSCPGVGERLKNPRSICNYCYAYYGRLGQMKAAMETLRCNWKMLEILTPPGLQNVFIDALKTLPKGQRYFRWFGCGDAGTPDLENLIIRIANIFSEIRFWCPTQSPHFAKLARISANYLPRNLSLRPTQPLIGLPAPAGGHTTLLPEQKSLPGHFICPGKCDPCRACWDKKVSRIAFPFHGNAVLMRRFLCARKKYDF